MNTLHLHTNITRPLQNNTLRNTITSIINHPDPRHALQLALKQDGFFADFVQELVSTVNKPL
jgi:hypothetical protein